MPTDTLYEQINAMEDFSFIAGSTFTLYFDMSEYNDDEEIIDLDLTGASVEWRLAHVGQQNNSVLVKTGTIDDTNSWHVDIESSDTEDLSGVFIQQPVITDFSGQKFFPAQSTVVIGKQNKVIS